MSHALPPSVEDVALPVVASILAPGVGELAFGADGVLGSTGLASALAGGALGAGSSAITGSNPLLGAVEGAGGGYLSGGGASELLNGAGDLADSADTALGGSGSIGNDLGITGDNSLSSWLSGSGSDNSTSLTPGSGIGGDGVGIPNASTPEAQMLNGDPILSGTGNAANGNSNLSTLLTGGSSAPVSAGGGASSFGNVGGFGATGDVGSAYGGGTAVTSDAGGILNNDPLLSGAPGESQGGLIPQSSLEGGGGFDFNPANNASAVSNSGSGGILGNSLGTNNFSGGGGFGSGVQAGANAASAGIANPTGTTISGIAGSQGGGNVGNLSSLLSGNPTLGQIAQIGGGINSYISSQNMADQLKRSQAQSNAELQPFLQNGTAASNSLSNLLGLGTNTGASNFGQLTTPYNPAQLLTNPGYQFQLQQGEQALNNQNAATGNTNSGAAEKEIEDFAQGLAGTDYNNAFNQNLAQNQQMASELSGQAGTGLSAANALSGINNNVGLANANASLAGSNILSGTLSQLLTGAGASPIGANGQPIYQNNNSNMNLTLAKLLGLQ